MSLSEQLIELNTRTSPEQTEWAKGLIGILDKTLQTERDGVHPTLAQVIEAVKEAELSPTARLYTLMLASCFVAHMEIKMEASVDGLNTILMRAYRDLQLAIAAGEIPRDPLQ